MAERFGGASALVAVAGGGGTSLSPAGAVASPPASSPPHTPPDGSGDAGRRASARAPKRKKFDDEVFVSTNPKGPKRHKADDMTGTPEPAPLPVEKTAPVIIVQAKHESHHTPTARQQHQQAQAHAHQLQQQAHQAAVHHHRSTTHSGTASSYPTAAVSTTLATVGGDLATATALPQFPPLDDYKLIINTQQVCDLIVVHQAVKFSRHYSLRDLRERWFAILYHLPTSRVVSAALATLDTEARLKAARAVLFSPPEESLLRTVAAVPGTTAPPLETFAALLERETQAFFFARTPLDLRNHWRRLALTGLLAPDATCARYAFALPLDSRVPATTLTPSFADACERLAADYLQRSRGGLGDDAGAAAQTISSGAFGGGSTGGSSSSNIGGGSGIGSSAMAVLNAAVAAGGVGGGYLLSSAYAPITPRSAEPAGLDRELLVLDRKQKRKIARLEQQLGSWPAVIAMPTYARPAPTETDATEADGGSGVAAAAAAAAAAATFPEAMGYAAAGHEIPPLSSTFGLTGDTQTLAVLHGTTFVYKMVSKKITVGRNSPAHRVDVDLTSEGSVSSVSRLQCTIKLYHDGVFYLTNKGKHVIYMNGQALVMGISRRLFSNSVIEIADMKLFFIVNEIVLRPIRKELLA